MRKTYLNLLMNFKLLKLLSHSKARDLKAIRKNMSHHKGINPNFNQIANLIH